MQELKKKRQWVCWDYSFSKDRKRTKIPCSAQGGPTGTDEPHRYTWVAYDEAEKAAAKNKCSGVGFVLPEGYFLLDLDHMGLTDPFVQMLLRRFDNTYAEESVSGNGIHIIGKIDLPQIPTYINANGQRKLDKSFYQKNSKKGIELYIGGLTNRFATYSGKVIQDTPIQDCTSAVLLTLEKDMRKTSSSKQISLAPVQNEDELVILSTVNALRNQNNGNKFSKLYDQGDFSDYGSQSEADAALCAMIAFRTGPDPTMIDAVFRGSALYRDKWEREDYRESTIAVGIEACHNEFHRSVMPQPPFIRFHEKTGLPQLIPTLLAKHIRETMPYILVRDNGRQGVQIYVYQDGYYRQYAKEMMLGAIKAPVEAYDENLVSMGKINEVYNLLVSDLKFVSQEDLNTDEHLINFQNGLLRVDQQDLTLLPHDQSIYSTIQIPCAWTGYEQATPVFDNYLDKLTDGRRDVVSLLLEFIGVCLSNVKGWRTKTSLFLVGSGDTGKSVLKSLVEKILGRNNFIGIDLQEIEARFGTGAIYGKRLAGSSDMSFLSISELKTFKKLTGGDSLFAEFKGQQGFEYTYNGLLWFCMNRLPKFGGDDGQWVYDRIMIVRCPNVIPKSNQDKELLDKLYDEREGIIYKAVKALQTVIRNGYRFSEPECVITERQEYLKENNSVIGFYEDCMCNRQSETYADNLTTGQVYSAYKAWCADNNNGYAKTAKEFRDTLSAHLGYSFGDLTVHTAEGTCYRNLTLTDEAKRQYGVCFI